MFVSNSASFFESTARSHVRDGSSRLPSAGLRVRFKAFVNRFQTIFVLIRASTRGKPASIVTTPRKKHLFVLRDLLRTDGKKPWRSLLIVPRCRLSTVAMRARAVYASLHGSQGFVRSMLTSL